MYKSRFVLLLGMFSLLLFAAYQGAAQTSRGTLTGVVTDSSGAVVAKANVKITQAGTNLKRETSTNEAGIYRFDAVDLGTYSLSIQAPGFRTKDTTGVEIEAAHTTNIDVALEVGAASETVTVEASAFEVQLQTAEQVRGANFGDRTVGNLPITGLDSLTVTQLLPGVTTINMSASNSINQNGTFAFSVNGQRPRGNNFMIDGVENNDISIGGPAYTITNPDAVEEVNVQTSNFSAEFGRAGGAVVNQITKSGTNGLHGSATYVYDGSAFNALSHLQKIGGLTSPPRQVENIPDFTIGGPVILPHLYNGHDKTFFFAAAQWDRLFGDTTSSNPLRLPTDAGVATLQSLAAQCPNAALYLKALGSLRGNPNTNPSNISLTVPSAAGTCDNSTRTGLSLATGLFIRQQSFSSLDNNHQIRIDHRVSNKQTMSFRWLYDNSVAGPSLNNLPGFDNEFTGRTMTGNFTDTYVINSRWTNEFRFNYGRIGFNFPLLAPDSFHATSPSYSGLGVTGFGGRTNIPQFRFANNWQYQDTMSYVRGTHTFRFGGDFLRQLARQHPPFNERGSFAYAASAGGVSAFSDFLDDFGGNGGSLNRQFGSPIYHPNLFRQSYFFEDSWKTTQNLTLNLGLRYENFGTPVNTFSVAAFTNYDPVNFAAPHPVQGDNNNFAPTVGFAWNPKGEHLIDRMMGGRHMVWRGGFQVSYDTWFNNLLSNIAGSSPNTLGGTIPSTTSAAVPRGVSNFSAQFAGIQPTAPTAQSAQNNLFLQPFSNPYTDRWSLGFERELPYGMIWDTSYVGSVSHKLFRTIDMNPLINDGCGSRVHSELQILPAPCATLTPAQIATRASQGIRTVRATSANSNYESLQLELKRRFTGTPVGAVQFDGAYTYAHYMDDVSDVFGFDSTPSSFQSVPQLLGGSRHLDYGNSDFDRRHVATLGVLWDVRGPRQGLLGSFVGGWQLSTISFWQSGIPYTVVNGTDRNGDGQSGPDRPDVSNAGAPLNTRAVIKASCTTGFGNPDATGTPCIDPATVHFIEGTGLPNARTAGRNGFLAPALDDLDVAISKRFRFNERMNLEFRADMFNAFNMLNLGYRVASRTVNGTAGGAFLDFNQTESVPRTMRMRLKFSF
ncbi:MAG TPA: carboxypeptidase regulatory-like domain-containing protein [Candidatus Acidoferrum sp.]|nr:carboxypeptidase regulatory-like domain-containing protein [Candidatus Acidoferrum sp.]